MPDWTMATFEQEFGQVLTDLNRDNKTREEMRYLYRRHGLPTPRVSGEKATFKIDEETDETPVGDGLTLGDLSAEARTRRAERQLTDKRRTSYDWLRRHRREYSDEALMDGLDKLGFPRPETVTRVEADVFKNGRYEHVKVSVPREITENEAREALEAQADDVPSATLAAAAFGDEARPSEGKVRALSVVPDRTWKPMEEIN